MKKRYFYSSIVFILTAVFIACNTEQNTTLEEENYKKMFAEVNRLEQNHQIDSAFIKVTNYINNTSLPYSYRNKAKLKLAWLYQIQCDFSESEVLTVEVLDKNTDKEFEPHIHNMLGILYKEQKQYKKSLEHYKIAQDLSDTKLHKAIIQNNIGVVYLKNNNSTKSIQTLLPLLQNEALKEKPKYYAKAVDNLGYAYIDSNPKLADSLLFLGYKIRDSIQDNYSKIASTVHLSKLFASQNNYQKATAFAAEAYTIATTVKSPDDRLEALDLLIRYDDQKKWYPLFNKISDSITTVRQNNRNEFAKIKYDNSKALEQLNKQKNLKIILLIAIAILLIIGVLLVRLFQLKNKKDQLNAIYETETKIAKKVHDELANDIFQTLSFVEIKDKEATNFKDNLLDKLDKIYTKSRNISRENNVIATNENYVLEVSHLISGFNTSSVQIITKGLNDINWLKTTKEKKVAIYRVLQELLINTKKHSKASVVLVSFEKKLKTLHITFKDNGIGISDLKLKNGLANVENRIENVSGTCIFESDNGFKVQINIPF